MKTLILTITILSSLSSFATEKASNLFIGSGRAESDIPLLAGCSDAKEEAISHAKLRCYEAGYAHCEEVETVRIYRRGSNPLRNSALLFISLGNRETSGVCAYRSVFQGFDE
ncbi:MAG: hypothetical protein CME69_00055 [Halobacteriovorax sp.]|nr:hypothetical protein [Halobacteriovorax sp.]|tara:strand:+ start:390 stop:725 length:336 start_codon:yes stop_codon:yes gene_type:complete